MKTTTRNRADTRSRFALRSAWQLQRPALFFAAWLWGAIGPLPAAFAQGTVESNEGIFVEDVEDVEGDVEDNVEDNVDDDVDDLGLLELDVPMIVTASRHEEKASKVPYAISIITANDIRQSGARSIPDALRLATGVDVADLSYGQAAVSPRGLHSFVSRQTLVLVDGRQISDALFGGTLWGNWPFMLDDIARIEVIRGAGGVTWGGNALNGVINIITKDPRDQLGFSLLTAVGSRGMNREYARYGVEEGPLRLRVSAEHESSDGWRGGSLFGRGDDSYRAGRFSVYAVYEPRPEDTFTYSAGSALLKNGFAGTPLAGIGMSRQPGGRASYLLAKLQHRRSSDEHYEITAYINDFQSSPGIKQVDYQYQQFAIQFSHVSLPSPNHTLTWGIDSRADMLDSSNSEPRLLSKSFVSTGIIGIYMQDAWALAPRWTLDLGGRMDYEFYGGFQPSARAALSYTLSDHGLLYASVSRAFQMVPASLRFLDLPLLNGLSAATGRRGINARTLIDYELGLRDRWFDKVAINANFFWNAYKDITSLAPRLGPPGLLAFELDNRATVDLYGFEFDAQYPVNEKLTLLANYTYEQLRWNSNVDYSGTDAMMPPKNKFMLAARYSPTEDLHLSSHLYYVDASRAPNVNNPFGAAHINPYFRLDLRAEYEFWNDDASIAVGVRNLLDKGHTEGGTLFLDTIQSERTIFAELRLSIRQR